MSAFLGGVLVAGADPKRWQPVRRALGDEYSVAFAIDLRGTLDLLEREKPVVLLVCSDLLDASAQECVERARSPSGPKVLLVDDSGTTIRGEPLLSAVRALLAPPRELSAADAGLYDLPAYRAMVLGTSPAIRKVVETIRRIARVDVTVLLTGETGTGKELFARRIHCLSHRASGPFRAVNLPAVPRELFESVLFGHERGSFTGAVNQTVGVFEQAQEGTLFLDEISSLDSAGQPKLLRAIQEKEIERVGARAPQPCDVRIVAATNADLAEAVERREFREDLYYRLSVVTLEIPPLRRRIEDIPLLVDFFLQKYAAEFCLEAPELGSGTMDALRRYEWPGNIRELQNRVQHALLLSDTTKLQPQDFLANDRRPTTSKLHFDKCEYSLAEVEQAYIEAVLERNEGNQSRTAQILGIDRKTLRTRRRKSEPGPAQSLSRSHLQSVS